MPTSDIVTHCSEGAILLAETPARAWVEGIQDLCPRSLYGKVKLSRQFRSVPNAAHLPVRGSETFRVTRLLSDLPER